MLSHLIFDVGLFSAHCACLGGYNFNASRTLGAAAFCVGRAWACARLQPRSGGGL